MLNNLHIKNFRCFEDLQIESLGRVNLIVGKNNSGKSSLLEAVYLYANGGNTWAIADILSKRHEFYLDYRDNPSKGLDSLDSIFFNKYNPNGYDLSISAGDNEINIVFIDDIEDITHQIANQLFVPPPMIKSSAFGETVLVHTNNLIDNLRGSNDLPLYSNCSFVSTEMQYEKNLAKLWDDIQSNAEDEKVEELLKIIEPRLNKLFFIQEEFNNHRTAKIRLSAPTEVQTLRSLGEGVTRLLQITLHSFKARSGILLIDEFENGLHYSIQQEIWDKLFKLATELDIQIFATTHSEDTIKAFCKASLNSEEEGRLISLGRSTRTSTKGQIKATVFNEDELEVISNTGMDVR